MPSRSPETPTAKPVRCAGIRSRPVGTRRDVDRGIVACCHLPSARASARRLLSSAYDHVGHSSGDTLPHLIGTAAAALRYIRQELESMEPAPPDIGSPAPRRLGRWRRRSTSGLRPPLAQREREVASAGAPNLGRAYLPNAEECTVSQPFPF